MGTNNKIPEMLHTNQKQDAYYEKANGSFASPRNSLATDFWRLRRNAFSVFRNAEIQESIVQLHAQWIEDVPVSTLSIWGLGKETPYPLSLQRRLVGTLQSISLLRAWKFSEESYVKLRSRG